MYTAETHEQIAVDKVGIRILIGPCSADWNWREICDVFLSWGNTRFLEVFRV